MQSHAHCHRSSATDPVPGQTLLQSWLRIGLYLSVLGAVVLPLVPVWTGLVAAIGIAWLLTHDNSRRRLVFLSILLLVPNGLYLIGWLAAAASGPLEFFVNGLLHPYGHPIGVLNNSMQLIGQAALVLALVLHAWRSSTRGIRMFVAACAGFALWAVIAGVWNAAAGLSERPEIIISGSAVWVNWAVLAILGALVFEDYSPRGFQLHSALSIAAVLLAAAIVLQWIVGDYSYVLVTYGSEELFARVRASYYYHAPATQCVAFLSPIVILASMRRASALALATILLIGIVFWVNDTRALSLATAFGFVGFAALLILTGRLANTATVSAVLIVAVVSTQILYVKPGVADAGLGAGNLAGISTSGPDAAGEGDVVQEGEVQGDVVQEGDVDSVLSSNALRRELAIAGYNVALERPFTGFGPGNGRILVPGNQTNQKRYEVSSHALAIDLAMMGGFPALIAFAAIFGIASLSALGTIVRQPRSDRALANMAFVTALAIFAMSSFFHPQERSYIIAVAMMLAGLLAAANLRKAGDAPQATETLGQRRAVTIGAGFMAIGLAGWLFVTSPGYVFPALEFVARYARELREDDMPVRTSNVVLNQVVKVAMAVVGAKRGPELLADNLDTIPDDKGFIVWSPADEPRYPELRTALGPAQYRRYGQWLSVDLLPSWTLLDNYQPTVQFLRVGAFPNVEVSVGKPEGYPFGVDNDAEIRLGPELGLVDASELYLRFEGVAHRGALISWKTDSGQEPTSLVAGADDVVPLPAPAPGSSLELSVSATRQGTESRVFATMLVTSMPSVTHLATARLEVGGQVEPDSRTERLMDLSDSSATLWGEADRVVLELEFDEPFALAAYQIMPQISGPKVLPSPLEWRLEARTPDGRQVEIDSRKLSAETAYGVGFAVAPTEKARRYRFVFPAREENRFVQIQELNMYPRAN